MRAVTLCAALLLVTVPSWTHAAIRQAPVSIAAGTSWTGNGGGSGRCGVLITATRTQALVHCTLEGGAPLDAIHLVADGFDEPLAIALVNGGSPYEVIIAPLSAAAVRALATNALHLEGHTDAGVEVSGTLTASTDTVQFTAPLRALEAVPPSSSSATGLCQVTVAFTPPLVGVDCTHDMAEPERLTLNLGASGTAGDVILDLSNTLGGANPAVWTPLDSSWQIDLATSGTYLELAAGGEVIRGQVDGCRTMSSVGCAFDRFTIRATTQATNASEPARSALGEALTTPFTSLVTPQSGGAQTQTFLFRANGSPDHALLVEIVDGCDLGQGLVLNAVGVDTSDFQFLVTFDDLFFGGQMVLSAHRGAPVDRRHGLFFPCFLQ